MATQVLAFDENGNFEFLSSDKELSVGDWRKILETNMVNPYFNSNPDQETYEICVWDFADRKSIIYVFTQNRIISCAYF